MAWQWYNERGQVKDFAARSFLLKLAAGGYVQLPALQTNKRRTRRAVSALAGWQEPAPWAGCLADLQPLQVEVVVAGTEAYQRWAFYLAVGRIQLVGAWLCLCQEQGK